MAVRPTEARRLPDQRRLRLVWDDGHAGEYAYQELRGWCPCAGCQGHGEDIMREIPRRRRLHRAGRMFGAGRGLGAGVTSLRI